MGSQKFLPQNIGPGAFSAKILCENHNSKLSILDTEATKFFTAILHNQNARIDGELLERWLIKVLLGCYKAGVFNGQFYIKPEVFDNWVAALLGSKYFKYPNGLWHDITLAVPALNMQHFIKIDVLEYTNEILGIGITILGINLKLHLANPSIMKVLNDRFYRPGQLEIDCYNIGKDVTNKFKIDIDWMDNYQHKNVYSFITSNTDVKPFGFDGSIKKQ